MTAKTSRTVLSTRPCPEDGDSCKVYEMACGHAFHTKGEPTVCWFCEDFNAERDANFAIHHDLPSEVCSRNCVKRGLDKHSPSCAIESLALKMYSTGAFDHGWGSPRAAAEDLVKIRR